MKAAKTQNSDLSLTKLVILGIISQVAVTLSMPARAENPSRNQIGELNTKTPQQNRRIKFDSELQRLYDKQQLRRIQRQQGLVIAQGLHPQAESLQLETGRPNPNLRGDLVNVSISFSRMLSAEELATYESTGVRFMRTPNGDLANVDKYYPAWVTEIGMDALAMDELVTSVEPGSDSHAKPPLDVSREEVEAHLRHNTPTWTDNTGNRGKGVKIAVFDTGIDIFHPDFFHASGIQPYDWIDSDNNGVFNPGTDYVDLDRDNNPDSDERLNFSEPIAGYGSTYGVYDVDTDWLYNDSNFNNQRDFGPAAGYTEQHDCYGELIFYVIDTNENDRLDPGEKLVQLGKSKIRKAMVGNTVYTRGYDLINTPIDQNGHGTSVSSIIVGQDPDYSRRHAGIAPDAELYVIDRYASPNHLATLAWARGEGVRLFLWEFGGWIKKFLDGSTALENAISTGAYTGEIHVVPNGNLGVSERHAVVSTNAQGGLTTIDMNVPINVNASSVFVSVLWRGAGDNVQFDLARDGNTFTRINPIPSTVSDHTVTGYYSTSNRNTHRFDMTLYKQSGVDTGDWTLRIQNANPQAVTFHLWAGENDVNISWNGGVKWNSNVTSANTITWPATADQALNVASYSVSSSPGQLSGFSGRGPRIDGYELNDIAAPGHHDIACAQSSGAAYLNAWGSMRTNFGGTSAAGPHVTGAVALLMQAVPDASPPDILDALMAGAQEDSNTGNTPNEDWGFGKLRVEQAYQILINQTCPIIAAPSPISPAYGETVSPDELLQVNWLSDPVAELYDLYLGDTQPPQRYVAGLYANGMSIISSNLEPDTTYYWYVVARNSCGYTRVGPTSTFSTNFGAASLVGPEIDIIAAIPVDQETMIRDSIEHNDTFDFGDVDLGQSVSQVFMIHNAGDEELNLTGNPRVQMVGSGSEFDVSFQPFTDICQPSQDLVFALRFTPQAAGTHGAQILIFSNDLDEPSYRVYLEGTGLEEVTVDPNEPTQDPNEPTEDPNQPLNDPNEPIEDPNEPFFDDPNNLLIDDPNLVERIDPNLADPNLLDPNQFDPNYLDPNYFDPNQFDPNFIDPNSYDPNEYDPNSYVTDPNELLGLDPNQPGDGEIVIVPAPCGLGLIAPALLGFATSCCVGKRRRKL